MAAQRAGGLIEVERGAAGQVPGRCDAGCPVVLPVLEACWQGGRSWHIS